MSAWKSKDKVNSFSIIIGLENLNKKAEKNFLSPNFKIKSKNLMRTSVIYKQSKSIMVRKTFD